MPGGVNKRSQVRILPGIKGLNGYLTNDCAEA